MSKDLMESADHDLNLLAAYVEDRVDAVERARVVAHLAVCPECRSTLAGYVRAAASAPDLLVTAKSGPSWFRQTRVWLPAAATVLLTTAAIVGGLRLRDADDRRPAVSPENAASPEPARPSENVPLTPADPPAGIRSGNQAIAPKPSGDDLLRRRSGERIVGGKTFRLVAGEWIDEAYDPLAAFREVDVRSANERRALLQRIPALRPFVAIGGRVIVVHEGTVYKFGTDPLQ